MQCLWCCSLSPHSLSAGFSFFQPPHGKQLCRQEEISCTTAHMYRRWTISYWGIQRFDGGTRNPWRIFPKQCGKVWELTLPIQTLPLPVGGDCPAISCPSTKDSHPFCAVPAPTELLPWYNTDDKGRDLGEAEGLRLLQVSILPATEAENTSSVSFPRAPLPAQCWHSVSLVVPRNRGCPSPTLTRGERRLHIFQFSKSHIFVLSAWSSRFLKGITLPSLGFKARFNEFDEPV